MDDLNAAERAILAEIEAGQYFIALSAQDMIALRLEKRGLCRFVEVINEPQEFLLPAIRWVKYERIPSALYDGPTPPDMRAAQDAESEE